MNPYALIPLVSCVLCTSYCLSGWSGPASLDDRRRRAYTRSMIALFAIYMGLETGFKITNDSGISEICLRLSGFALICIGPMSLATVLRLALRPHVQVHQIARVLNVVGLLLIAIEAYTGGMSSGTRETRFGVLPIPGPLYMPVIGYALFCGGLAFKVLSRAIADSPNFEAGPVLPRLLIRVSVVVLLIGTGVTDIVLPILNIEAPAIASLGFGLIALSALSSITQRDGDQITTTPALVSEHILHALNDGVAFLATDGRVLLANESLTQLVGADALTLVAQPLSHYLPDLDFEHPADRADLECELQSADGQTRPVSITFSTVRNGRGAPLGRVLVVRDVRELKTIKNRLVMSGRLAAVGQMAAGIAHEINNPISFVRTNLGVLREHWTQLGDALTGAARDEKIEEMLKDGEELIAESVEGIDRAAGIVRDVRELSHVGSSGHIHGNLNHILERVIRLVSSEMAPGITIERRFEDGCRAQFSPDQMTQVFVNLLTNAIHAVAQGGRIVVQSTRQGDRVQVHVIDDGDGVPEANRDRIFDPFYTTKEVGVGTGLGLSISHEIVRGHGGELIYSPDPGGGARFTVHLAASPDRNEGTAAESQD